MPDIVVRHMDNLLAERIKTLARERQCAINDVLLHALRHGVGLSATQEFSETTLCDEQVLGGLDGQWDTAEKQVFQEALQALASARPTQLAPAAGRDEDAVAGGAG